MEREARVGGQQAAWLAEFSVDQTIAAGLEEDIERIVYLAFDQFEKQEGPRFELFKEIWQKTGLGQLFSGRESFREMYEFTEELLARVKRFAMAELHKKPNHQLVRFSALYMLYSLYFKQPCRPRARIRLVLAELEDLQATVDLARRESHWDVMYAWCKLVTSHAFHYTACPGQMGLEVAQQMEQREVAERGFVSSREDYFKSKEYLGLIKKLGKAHGQYSAMKNSLASSRRKEDRGLFLADQVFPDTLRKLSKRKEQVQEGGEGGTIGRKRRELKDRAFTDEELRAMKKPRFDEEEWRPSPGVRGRGRGKRTIGRGRGRGRGKRAGGKRREPSEGPASTGATSSSVKKRSKKVKTSSD